MKLYSSVFLFFVLTFNYGQEISQDKMNASYEEFLKEVGKKEKDTLIKQVSKRYNCSEYFSGNIYYYYKNDQLKLIKHIYKQNWDNSLEYYYIENDTLRLYTTFTEIIRANTRYTKSEREASFSMEKVLDVTENRSFLSQSRIVMCHERQDMKKQSEWDQDFFNTLSFKKVDCTIDIEDLRYKYRILRKAEKKLVKYGGKPYGCIFYLW
ncbi:hypothetical protein [Aquimarina macrocephali]|uniref:hypothetical protein n=1 Tax=Aquimarina macrocephali TaxID=666563 RepID=UPI001267EA49|nr:hypothetical protein [Aquimarina macrocephali]